MDRKVFFGSVRREFFPGGLKQVQVDNLNILLDAFEEAKWSAECAANGLGTVLRECGPNMAPVREGFKDTDEEARAFVRRKYPRKYGKPTEYGGQYAYGRGYVQLTWADTDPDGIDNYGKADKELSRRGYITKGDLIANFDLALRPDLAARIMVLGMDEGWFTGKRNSHYFGNGKADFVNARRIINGLDHAEEIAANSRKFLKALKDAGWGQPSARVQPAPAAPQPVEPPPPVPSLEPVPTPTPPPQKSSMFDFFRNFFGKTPQ